MNEPTTDQISEVMRVLGQRGGKSTSPAKRAAGRRNVAKALKARLAKRKKTRRK